MSRPFSTIFENSFSNFSIKQTSTLLLLYTLSGDKWMGRYAVDLLIAEKINTVTHQLT